MFRKKEARIVTLIKEKEFLFELYTELDYLKSKGILCVDYILELMNKYNWQQ